MHIPDGFLTGEAALVGVVVGASGLAVCLRGVARESRERDLPVAGLAAAFFLVGDAPLFPVGVGTQGHLLGGLLAVALLGPWLGATTIAVVTMVQALALGDGGITTLGLGVVNLALVPAVVGYPLLLLLRRILPTTPVGLAVACGLAAWVSVLGAASLFTLEFVVGAARAIDTGTLATATLGTYAVIGAIEGVITALIVVALVRVRPDLVRAAGPLRERHHAAALDRQQRPASASAPSRSPSGTPS